MANLLRPGNLALAVVALSCAVLVARRATAERRTVSLADLAVDHGVVVGTDTAPEAAPRLQDVLSAFKVKDLNGKTVPLVLEGQPTIVMINSRTCPWCKKSLKDIGELSRGRPLPRLTVLTLEGAAEAEPMLALEKITGATLVGPVGTSEQLLKSFRNTGTPTFIAVDRNGRVVRTMPGYPIIEEMKHWHAVMLGETEVP
ncbi:MAG TPA: TlpA disulfide reductase family protein [Gemmatimonas sp.]|uniref:TlpA family protein disulfide reductase n=1 Tax=Gemmatimonas sp. TaxID=1962908 RepID=UPI002EDA21A4